MGAEKDFWKQVFKNVREFSLRDNIAEAAILGAAFLGVIAMLTSPRWIQLFQKAKW